MQLTNRFQIKSEHRIIDFLNSQPVGRICSIDIDGFPQVIPMNFVFATTRHEMKMNKHSTPFNSDAIYMHSHPLGEKIENIKRNSKVGFEVDQHVCFLPSYYFHPTDASQADTLYISVVIKGNAYLVDGAIEKAFALNLLMKKYQTEGIYESLNQSMRSVRAVSVIKIVPQDIRGKYKIGQHWTPNYRLKIAEKIKRREGIINSRQILNIMGLEEDRTGKLYVKREPVM
ncbi:MAG TPA: pyridoxamine 5'-phosphate oxidase family protein [Nitrososphaeraceae archaeon]|nr:pyridoxamine 5'-phosphate oxidase family protein [Nitrososphaeraceae archaeon]